MDTLAPTFHVQIEGKDLGEDVSAAITQLVYDDVADGLDQLELSLMNRYMEYTDAPLLQEGNKIVARFGYVGNLSPIKTCYITESEYDFPAEGIPSIRLKCSDQSHVLLLKEKQRVWKAPPPGISYDEIASQIAAEVGLIPVVVPTFDRELSIPQANQSDATFLAKLAEKARVSEDAKSVGFAFYADGGELHFHPLGLDMPPVGSLTFYLDRSGMVKSFKPSVQTSTYVPGGAETKAVGVDAKSKAAIDTTTTTANNETASARTVLGPKTYLGSSQNAGRIVPVYDVKTARAIAEGRFCADELRQIEATATTVGLPWLRSKTNLEICGVGAKFSGIYYVTGVRHTINGDGYSCELSLRRSALGKTAGQDADATAGRQNTSEAPA